MKQLKRKLCSNAGASMILALLFLMFCMFIGGSVLAAATVNAGRVHQRTSGQQEELNQRSAAITMAEMLQSMDDQMSMQLVIQEVCVENLGEDGVVDSSRSFRFSLPTDTSKPAVQRVVYEHVINNFWSEKRIEQNEVEGYVNFLFDDMTDPGAQYVFEKYTEQEVYAFKITDPFDPSVLLEGTMEFVGHSKLVVSFASEGQVELILKCTKSENIKQPVIDGNCKTTETVTTYLWEKPVIKRGGESS